MRILPYFLPALLTMLFIGLAYVDSTLVFAVLLFGASIFNSLWGVFSPVELSREYEYFHHARVMSVFKGLNGVFFVGFNIWVAVFCVLHPFGVFSFVTFVYGVITVNSGFGLSLAHELIHENRHFHRRLGEVLMLQNGFFYLSYDHVFIHHRHVGTADDPASALLHENLYDYLRRSISGRMRMIFAPVNGAKNARQVFLQQAVRWKMAICAAWLIAAALLHPLLLLLAAAQFFFVILVYETTTYIQHYGLRRSPQEKVRLRHSWNSYDRLYNYLYFFMPVHSLHHANIRPEAADSYLGPVMPQSFPNMLFLAFQPARWFRTMDPLVLQMQENQGLQSPGTYE